MSIVSDPCPIADRFAPNSRIEIVEKMNHAIGRILHCTKSPKLCTNEEVAASQR